MNTMNIYHIKHYKIHILHWIIASDKNNDYTDKFINFKKFTTFDHLFEISYIRVITN